MFGTFCQLIFWYIQKQSSTAVLQEKVLQNFENFYLCRSVLVKELEASFLQLHQKTPALMFSGEFCKICRNTYFIEHLGTTAPTFSKVFMTANFSYCNYDVVNYCNIWKKMDFVLSDFLISYIELRFRIFLYIFYYI